jgi:adenylyltransferase/sulfurtransferase
LWTGNVRRIQTKRLKEEGNCLACRGNRDFLNGTYASQTTVLCGRNSVQVMPDRPSLMDLQSLADRWSSLGKVLANAYLVRMTIQNHSITVFGDGRAVIQGTEDPSVARTLYSKWVGC